MKQTKQISTSSKYTAIDIGNLDELMGYVLKLPDTEVKGKVFLKELTGATGTEISFSVLAAESEVPFFHSHRQSEETYIILKGHGFFQVDDDCFPIKEGSVIRVGTGAMRCHSNESKEDMIYIVVQSKESSLGQHTFQDGEIKIMDPKWRKK